MKLPLKYLHGSSLTPRSFLFAVNIIPSSSLTSIIIIYFALCARQPSLQRELHAAKSSHQCRLVSIDRHRPQHKQSDCCPEGATGRFRQALSTQASYLIPLKKRHRTILVCGMQNDDMMGRCKCIYLCRDTSDYGWFFCTRKNACASHQTTWRVMTADRGVFLLCFLLVRREADGLQFTFCFAYIPLLVYVCSRRSRRRRSASIKCWDVIIKCCHAPNTDRSTLSRQFCCPSRSLFAVLLHAPISQIIIYIIKPRAIRFYAQ